MVTEDTEKDMDRNRDMELHRDDERESEESSGFECLNCAMMFCDSH